MDLEDKVSKKPDGVRQETDLERLPLDHDNTICSAAQDEEEEVQEE